MSPDDKRNQRGVFPLRVAVLTNILLYHRVALLEAFSRTVRDLTIFLSSRNESNRSNEVRWGSLQVRVQKSISWIRRFQNIHGFTDVSYIHIPVDTYTHLRRYGPDVVISGEFGARTIFAAAYRRFHPRSRLVIWATLSSRTEQTRGLFRQKLRRSLLRFADAVFVNGQDGELYVRALGFTGPISHIPYVIENKAFARVSPRPPTEVIHLLYTGQFIERKGLGKFLETLIHWAKDHPETFLSLRLVGRGPLHDEITAIAANAPFPVTIVNHLELEEVIQQYQESTIYVLPTLADEWGIVVNESLCAGVPVLGSCYSGAVMELVRDGVNGWVFDPASEASVHEAFDRAFSMTPAQLTSMSEACRQTMLECAPEVIATRMSEAIAAIAPSA